MNEIEQFSTERLIPKDSEKDNRISPNQIIQKLVVNQFVVVFILKIILLYQNIIHLYY